MSQEVFRGGVPTEPDVQKLLEAFGRPEIGRKFSYEEIATILNTHKKTARYRTVTWVWREEIKQLYNIIIGCERGKGFIALNNSERLRFGVDKYKSGLHFVEKAQGIVAGCDDAKLSEPERESKNHIVKISGSLLLSAKMEERRSLPGPALP